MASFTKRISLFSVLIPHSNCNIISSNLHAVKCLSTNQPIHPEAKQPCAHLSNHLFCYFTNYPPIHLILYSFSYPQSHATRSYAPTNQTHAPKATHQSFCTRIFTHINLSTHAFTHPHVHPFNNYRKSPSINTSNHLFTHAFVSTSSHIGLY